MSTETKIEWADSTFNPWMGCGKVSPACDNCYAEVSTPARAMKIIWGITAERVRTSPQNWNLPKRWEAQHEEFFAKHGRRQRVFCASLADVFDKTAPFEWRADLWNLIEATPHLEWLLLTKRIGNALNMLPINWHKKHPGNVRIGISVVNQEEADRDIPKLLVLNFPNFLSMEPLLGPVDLNYTRMRIQGARSQIARAVNGEEWIDWVIVGGESGHNARPMHPDWVRSLRDQCAEAGVPMLFKQWGEWRTLHVGEIPASGGSYTLVSIDERAAIASGCFQPAHAIEAMLTGTEFSWQCPVVKVGKKAAGRELDGRTWDGYPS